MIYRSLISVVLVCCGSAFAASPAQTQYAADTKKAAQQYAADKKVCADEADASARLQCRRDAKSAYDKALAEAKARLKAPPPSSNTAKATCTDCGTVTSVKVVEKDGEGSAIGMIAGGVGGAVLGHQVGGGVGKDLATVAGAVGGAYAGKKIEEKVRAHQVWVVSVQYPDNSTRSFEFKADPGYKAGDLVKNSGNSIARR